MKKEKRRYLTINDHLTRFFIKYFSLFVLNQKIRKTLHNETLFISLTNKFIEVAAFDVIESEEVIVISRVVFID